MKYERTQQCRCCPSVDDAIAASVPPCVEGGYPKARVVYVDPTAYDSEMKCCMGAFNTPTKFDGRYQINAFLVSTHVRNYTSGLQGVFEAQINLTMATVSADAGEQVVATGAFKGLAPSTQLVDVPMAAVGGGPVVVQPDLYYIIYVWYGGDLTYPAYRTYDLSIGPIASTQQLFTMGVDYEAAP